MHLQLIKDETCPTCGGPTVTDHCHHTHCNGQGFEQRTFSCGCVLAWSPNFNKLEIYTSCPNHPDIVDREAKRKKLIEDLLTIIDASDVDDVFKKSVHHSIHISKYTI